MTNRQLELVETLAAISRVAGKLAQKVAVLAAGAEAAEEQRRKESKRNNQHCGCRRRETSHARENC